MALQEVNRGITGAVYPIMTIRFADFTMWIFAALQFASSIPSGN